jgi:hydroxyacyl-ACP dehydratase HTD2-like protein with hotdog domain
MYMDLREITLHRFIFLYIIYKYPTRTSQETHYVSSTKPSWLMLFEETVAVYCENYMEHTNTLCGQKTQSVPHVSATKPNRLMLFRETVAVYCENHTEHTNALYGQNAEFWYVVVGSTYSNHWALEV